MTQQVQKLSGFRDFFAHDVYVREYVVNHFKTIFEKYGYEPLETPALEKAEIFSGELGEEAEKLFYKFKDQGEREVMLKYEVMISMCRAVAENFNTLTFPYKRYQIQKVWRAERPQKGRYREFTQCDADTIGSASVVNDAEFIQMGVEALEGLGFNKFQAQVSHRKLLNGIIQYSGASDAEYIPICLSIDKLLKIGKDGVEAELLEKRQVSKSVAEKILSLVTVKGDIRTLVSRFRKELETVPVAQEALDDLEFMFNYLDLAGIAEDKVLFAPFIARGLAYYTGSIWEFEILDGNVGSVAGCGRYDNTIERFVGQKVPATGGSFGVERIIEVLTDRQMVQVPNTRTAVLVTIFDKAHRQQAWQAANALRRKNIAVLLYPEPEKLDKQFKYADKRAIPYALVVGPEEVEKSVVTLKDLNKRSQEQLSLETVVSRLT